MALEPNVGGIDRVLRGTIGSVLLVAAVVAVLSGRRTTGLVAVLVSIGLLFNAATQFCGLNALLGIDTCPRDVES